MELASERCRPCDGDPSLTAQETEALLQEVPAWRREDRRIVREFRLRDFAAALEACRRIGEVAEQEGHHPDLHLTQ
ncbi:MAG TPA: 4a-hydroxytetrahydrobiopterin dehydratase, partial [Candidatus Thermoplasmatota archaeon]|nr:4a-hydroxytetrahydrobiopterin dehydratase [Candidatus Thermoplasmatota archaeon]